MQNLLHSRCVCADSYACADSWVLTPVRVPAAVEVFEAAVEVSRLLLTSRSPFSRSMLLLRLRSCVFCRRMCAFEPLSRVERAGKNVLMS
jgi:hypothetical protein